MRTRRINIYINWPATNGCMKPNNQFFLLGCEGFRLQVSLQVITPPRLATLPTSIKSWKQNQSCIFVISWEMQYKCPIWSTLWRNYGLTKDVISNSNLLFSEQKSSYRSHSWIHDEQLYLHLPLQSKCPSSHWSACHNKQEVSPSYLLIQSCT